MQTQTLETSRCAADPPRSDRAAEATPAADLRRVVLDSLRTSADDEEHFANVLRMRRTVLLALAVWPPFFLMDVAVYYLGFSATSLAWQAVVRWLPWCLLLGIVRILRAPGAVSRRQLIAIDTIACGSLSLSVSLGCLSFGGFEAHYAAGISSVLMCRSVLVHVPWRASLWPALTTALMYPVVLLLSTLWNPTTAAQLRQPLAMTIFGSHVVHILTIVAFTIGGSHVVWSLRRQIHVARQVDRYRLLRPLGRGGMGEVWVAHHATMRREVALKMLRIDRAHDPIAQRRFEREVKAMMELTHPNSVRVFDYGATEDGLLYYAMELLTGKSLADLIAEEAPLSAERSVEIMRQACGAVGEAHTRGIIHRDLKPENIFICAVPRAETFVKVLDFGIAKRTDVRLESALTRVEQTIGTPLYMPPEVALGEPADARADVYALGAVLYFMLTGAPPFCGRATTAVMLAHVRELPPPLSASRPGGLSPELEQIVLRCLAKAPKDRYRDATELQHALASLSP